MMKILFTLLATLSIHLFQTDITEKNIYDFTMESIDGESIQLSAYKGKTILIVNVASKCGLTPQYEDLQELYSQYKDKGLVILGFPANNFMGQEPGSNDQIKQFCSSKFNVSFPMFSKISVKGRDIHPLYKYLTKKSENGKMDAPVQWNFQKFLIDKEGNLVESFAPGKRVSDPTVLEQIKKCL